ncbi:MAG: tryptophan 2,3-dioxygenase [Candidatus Sericytochromatia bacterium]|nr:tryptophan 2,3-dioxygenase [Candidatus Tanganyikabacteria bacterium]
MTGPKPPDAPRSGVMTYGDYLKVPELLALQEPRSSPPHHDELLFIVIHQAYELWFKLILHEIENAIRYMNDDRVLRAHHFMRRVAKIQAVLLEQIHILETMSPAEFAEFRDNLRPASGFQSAQFREIEFLAGVRDEAYLRFFQDRPEVLPRLRRRLAEPSVWDAFAALIARRFPDQPQEAALRHIYECHQDHLELYLLAESLIDFDEHLSLWRYHHVRVVERVIGLKPGTGGSAGVAYLRTTVDKKAFPALWDVRAHLGTTDYGDGATR